MVMDMICCEGAPLDELDDETESLSTEERILEVDYDSEVTRLYKSIEEREWEEVLYFLETGKWLSTSILNVFAEKEPDPETQAKTWVTALDKDGNVRWCQLPLHAAVTFLAPHAIIQKLLAVYPKSVRCADDQDMLPLHYAFRFGAADDVVVLLLEKFPQAMGKAAVKNRLPLDLAQYGPRPERGKIIEFYMLSAVRNAKTEWDQEYETMVEQMKNESEQSLAAKLRLKERELQNQVNETDQLRRELSLVQREAAMEHRSMRSPRRKHKSMKVTETASLLPDDGTLDDTIPPATAEDPVADTSLAVKEKSSGKKKRFNLFRRKKQAA